MSSNGPSSEILDIKISPYTIFPSKLNIGDRWKEQSIVL